MSRKSKRAAGEFPIQERVSLSRRLKRYKYIYIMLIPVVLYYILFHYSGFYYAIIAFQNFKPMKGISGSKFVGLKHFADFLSGQYAWRVIRNTLLLNVLQILICFTAPIVFALMINQMADNKYKNVIQTATYMPHFISVVVVCGLLTQFCESDGVITEVLAAFGFPQQNLLSDPKYFRAIIIGSDLWQHMGWGTIIYLATLSGVDPTLHEAATIDGAGRLQRIIHVNLPAIVPVIVVQLIMRIGHIMSVGYEKIILLYTPATYETADVISTYVYRRGLYDMDYSYGAAVGLFNSCVNLIILVAANAFCRKLTSESLW